MMILKNIKLPSNSNINIEITDDKITKVEQNINGDDVVSFEKELYVSPGWIDGHAHAFNGYEFIGADIDTIGIKDGVTTLIDAGTIGSDGIDEFRTEVENSKTDVYTLMNISKIGIIAQNELEDLSNIDEQLFIDTYTKNKDLIIGMKARMSGSVVVNNGIIPLQLAKKIQSKLDLPLMIHVGNPPPDFDDILKLLGKNDVLTHCFHGKKSNIFDNSKNTYDLLNIAISKGLTLDTGHGTASFSFDICNRAFDKGLKADIISTDIYRKNRVNGPVYNMATTISKMFACGYTHQEIIDKITKVPAKVYKLNDRGTLAPGNKADLTLYEIIERPLEVTDSEGKTITLDKYFKVSHVVKNGELIEVNNDN